MNGNGNNLRTLRQRHQPGAALSAHLRRAVDTAMGQSGYSIRNRLEISADIAPRDVDPLCEALRDLHWTAIDRAQDLLGTTEEPTLVAVREVIVNMTEEQKSGLVAFVEIAAGGALLEGWIAGAIATCEKAKTRSKTQQQRPGR